VDPAPAAFNWGPAQEALLEGGETAMWGEGINKDNAAQYIWRGAAAVAERLWSPRCPHARARCGGGSVRTRRRSAASRCWACALGPSGRSTAPRMRRWCVAMAAAAVL
jgi:hypothetical protein